MQRQVSSRNQRVKGGFKMKNALHICLLVAVCVWLLYQMKHSHDKKKAFDDQSSKSSFKVEERPLGIRKFGREDLPRTAEVKPIGVPRIEDDVKGDDAKVEYEEEGSDGDPDIEEKGETKEADGVEDREHDESSHEAREISFRGDDASSEVVHIIQEIEHEEASQEAREQSFKADDASSAVAHVPQANELGSESEKGGTRNLDEDESEKTDRRNGRGGDPTAHNNNTSTRRDETPAVKDVSSKNATTSEETKNHGGGQPDMRIASIISNQTDKDRRSTESTMGDAAVLINNSTSFSNQRIYFQKNSTTVSVEWVEAPANLTGKVMDPANVTVSQYQTAAGPSVDGQVKATKLETHGEEKPVTEQKTDATVRQEEPEEIPKTSSATDGIGNAVQGESEKNVSGILNRIQSGSQEAATAK